MAVTIYAGWKETENGESVWKFEPVKIAQATSFTRTQMPHDPGQVQFATKGYFNVDEKPTDLGAIFVEKVLHNDLNKNKSTLYFFSKNSDESKLPFEMEYVRVYTGTYIHYYFYFIDRETGAATFGVYFEGRGSLSLVINSRYSGSSLQSLYESAENYVKNRELSKNYVFFMNFPEYAPLNPCINGIDGEINWYTAYNDEGDWYQVVNDYVKNLSCIYQWKHFLTGKNAYESMPELETQNNEKIVIGYPDSVVVHDHGKLNEIATSNTPERCYAFRYLTNATDLTLLFTNPISTNEEFVFLKNGWISRQIVSEGYVQLHRYKIGFGEKFFSWDCVSNPQNPVTEFGESVKANTGLYLITSPAYADLPAYKWAENIPENYNPGSFEESPFLLYRPYYSYQGGPHTEYWDIEKYGNTAYPRYVTNFGAFSDGGYYGEIVFSRSSTGDRETWLGILGGFTPGGTPEYGEGSRGGGFSKPGGGNGSFDDSSESIENGKLPSTGVASKLVGAYDLSDTAIGKISTFLTGLNLPADGEKKRAVTESIMQLKRCFFPTDPIFGDTVHLTIVSGLDFSATKINVQDVGNFEFEIENYFGNFLDFESGIKIYLPFVGFKDLQAAEVVGKKCTVGIRFDPYSCGLLYTISIIEGETKTVILEASGQNGFTIPITTTDYNTKISGAFNAISGAIQAGAGIATGNPILITSGVKTAAEGAISFGTSVKNFATSEAPSFVQTMGPMQIFLVITRKKWSLPENYGHVYGYPCNMTLKMEELTGYTEVEEIHLDGFPGTKEEKERLMAKLKKGVVIRG